MTTDALRSLAAAARRTALVAFMAEYNVLIPRREVDEWRLTPRLLGEVHALPTSRGVLVATNGVLCYILRGPGDLFLAHYDNFIPDGADDVCPERQTAAKGQSTKVRKLVLQYEV